jgi:3-dehydroquinate synthase
MTGLQNLDCDLHVFEVPDGEDGKSISTLTNLWNWLGAAGFTRTDLIVGIGGGAVTDLAGFAAASWLRGVDWIAVPTSLAGMVDASIGGKTGVNSDYGKNLIGAFHSPSAVIIDSGFLTTLSDRDFSAGMAEVIKCGFIADPQILTIAEAHTVSSLRENPEVVTELIQRAASVKAKVVSLDFKENFSREALNYGHTLGHAIEKHAKYSLRHGEAVSIGLVFAAELAHMRNLLTESEVERHRSILLRYALPISYDRQSWQKLTPLLALDKKARGNTIRFVALDGIGTTVRIEDITSSELDQAYERISS